MSISLRSWRLLATASVIAAAPLVASDGRIEINQAKALAGGVTAGDTPGFPVTITAPGSYLLTGNLDVRNLTNPQNVTAIEFVEGSQGATLDLGGFSLLGPNHGCGFFCTPTVGSGKGIWIDLNFISVANGTISGFGASGVEADQRSGGTFERLVVLSSGEHGIRSGGHRVLACEATFNGQIGFFLNYAIVQNSRAAANKSKGFAASNSIIEGSSAIGNASFGFSVEGGALLRSYAAENFNKGGLECNAVFATEVSTNNFFDTADLPAGCVAVGPNLCNGAICPAP